MAAAEIKLPIALEDLQAILNKYGVVSASVFGSFARGDSGPGSDLDLLVQPGDSTSLFDILDLQNELEKSTGHPVDVVTKIHPRFEPYIKPELVPLL